MRARVGEGSLGGEVAEVSEHGIAGNEIGLAVKLRKFGDVRAQGHVIHCTRRARLGHTQVTHGTRVFDGANGPDQKRYARLNNGGSLAVGGGRDGEKALSGRAVSLLHSLCSENRTRRNSSRSPHYRCI